MAETGFRIDGVVYDVPTLDSFTMDEAEILYKCSGLSLEDFAVDEDDPEQAEQFSKNLRNPGFIRAMMTVAYIRGNPGVTPAKAGTIIGKSNLIEAIQNFVGEVDADSPPEPERSGSEKPDSDASTESWSEPSGGTSVEGLAARDDPRVATGTSA